MGRPSLARLPRRHRHHHRPVRSLLRRRRRLRSSTSINGVRSCISCDPASAAGLWLLFVWVSGSTELIACCTCVYLYVVTRTALQITITEGKSRRIPISKPVSPIVLRTAKHRAAPAPKWPLRLGHYCRCRAGGWNGWIQLRAAIRPGVGHVDCPVVIRVVWCCRQIDVSDRI